MFRVPFSIAIQIKTWHIHLFQICQGFIFFFRAVHLYRCQIHTPTGFLHCYWGQGWWDTGAWWVQYSTNTLAGNRCGPLQATVSMQVWADVQFSATAAWATESSFHYSASRGSRGTLRQTDTERSEQGRKQTSHSWQRSSAPSVAVGGVRGQEPQAVPCWSVCRLAHRGRAKSLRTLKSNPSRLQHSNSTFYHNYNSVICQ